MHATCLRFSRGKQRRDSHRLVSTTTAQGRERNGRGLGHEREREKRREREREKRKREREREIWNVGEERSTRDGVREKGTGRGRDRGRAAGVYVCERSV